MVLAADDARQRRPHELRLLLPPGLSERLARRIMDEWSSSNSIVSRPTTGTFAHQFLAEVRAGRPTVIGAHTTIRKPPHRARGGYASSVEASRDQHRLVSSR